MRDGSTHRRSTSPQKTTWAPECAQVDDWRRQGRLDDLRALAEGASGLVLSRGLLHALLEELHISDDFDVLVGRVARQPASQYPRLLAIALLLRHSWCPQDLEQTAIRLGLIRAIRPIASATSRTTSTPRDGRHRRARPPRRFQSRRPDERTSHAE